MSSLDRGPSRAFLASIVKPESIKGRETAGDSVIARLMANLSRGASDAPGFARHGGRRNRIGQGNGRGERRGEFSADACYFISRGLRIIIVYHCVSSSVQRAVTLARAPTCVCVHHDLQFHYFSLIPSLRKEEYFRLSRKERWNEEKEGERDSTRRRFIFLNAVRLTARLIIARHR